MLNLIMTQVFLKCNINKFTTVLPVSVIWQPGRGRISWATLDWSAILVICVGKILQKN